MNLEKLKEIRLKKRLTQAKVARQVGVSVNSYRAWEQGVSSPSEENLAKLKEVLKDEM